MKTSHLIAWAILLFGVSASAASLPNWAMAVSKSAALDQFVTWMAQEPVSYRITSVVAHEFQFDPTHTGVEAIIRFDDTSGCKGREHHAQCRVVKNGTELACFQFLFECTRPMPARRITTLTPLLAN